MSLESQDTFTLSRQDSADSAEMAFFLGVAMGTLNDRGMALLVNSLNAEYSDRGIYSGYVKALRDKLTEALKKAGQE